LGEGKLMLGHVEGDLGVSSDVGVILPTYCEAQNIARLVAEIEALPLKVSILVIDDSSPDGTAAIAANLQHRYPNIMLLVRPQKSGLGSAITDGFRTFLSLPHIPQYVVTMDADYSHNPQDVPRLVAEAEGGFDLVVGSRYCRGGSTSGWPLSRKIISRTANTVARGILGLRLHDCTAGFRCYSTRFLTKSVGYLHSQTYDIQIETVKQAHSQRFRMAEVPVRFVNRKEGKSKLNMREIENYVSYIFTTILHR
jgi:dolichol-phosphate mannosyltransferase